jgi:hypothetical protein
MRPIEDHSMTLRILGEHPLAGDGNGKLKSHIATVFPAAAALVTIPGIHATQRFMYLDLLNAERKSQGLPPLGEQEEAAVWENSVDLIIEDDSILIRPDPDRMQLAYAADEALQEIVPKHKIKFLYVRNEKIRKAIERRGECWRITRLPKSRAEMVRMINASRMSVGEAEIYYYNKITGTHFLSCAEFAGLGTLDNPALRRQLIEIQDLAARINRQGEPEIRPFAAGEGFSAAAWAGFDFRTLDDRQLRAAHAQLQRQFEESVDPELRRDDLTDVHWRNRMYAALIGQADEAVSEETLLGLSAEFFMQIQWLPGGRIEEGELILDPILETRCEPGDELDPAAIYDDKCRGIIFNFVREYGDLEYINVGRVIGSLSRRQVFFGRRDVYIAVAKLRGAAEPIVNIIRMQKWGVREHLDDGKDLLNAIVQSEEYTEYILDRRLGCRQLGMNLPPRVTARKLSEKYCGKQGGYHGSTIWSTYFQRDYIRGIATDKIPVGRFQDETFALALARLLGRAAAPNMIVGRCDLSGNVLFDDGDEVVVEDAQGMPVDIVVADQTGTFVDYVRDLKDLAAVYARPVNRRAAHLACPESFAEAYLAAFEERFTSIQEEYRKRRRAFDTLFKHRPRDEKGSLAYRWERVLQRLLRADPAQIKSQIRAKLVLSPNTCAAATAG